MAGIKIVDLPALGRDLAATDLLELSLAGGTGSRKITGQEIINASKLNVGNTPIINGAVGQVLFQGTGDILQESANLFWDNTNARLGIGTSTPAYKLDLFEDVNDYNAIRVRSRNNSIAFEIGSTVHYPNSFYISKNNADFSIISTGFLTIGTPGATTITFITNNSVRSQITSGGNVLIGTTTDAGYKLDVNGTARVQGVTSISPAGNGVSLGSASANQPSIVTSGYFTSSGAIVTSNFNGRSFNHILGGQGAGVVSTFNSNAQGITTSCEYFVARGNINLTDGAIDLSAFNFSPTIVSEVGATIKAFASNLSAASNRWNLYLSGTAKNYIAGNTLIGTTTDNGYKLEVSGSSRFTNVINVGGDGSIGTSLSSGFIVFDNGNAVANSIVHCQSARLTLFANPQSFAIGGFEPTSSGLVSADAIAFMNASTTRMKIPTTGNVLIGTTTDAGFKLDVNGTGRFTNQLTVVNNGVNIANVLLNLNAQGGGTISSGNSVGNPSTYITMSGPVYYNPTSGTAGTFAVTGQSYMNSGTAQFNTLSVAPIINNTGTYNGTFRGFYYNPTLTSLTGTSHFAFHSTSGRVRFEGLPTSPTGLNAGDLWNDAGTLKIV